MKSVLLGVLVFFTFCNNIKAQLYEIELTGHIRTNGRPASNCGRHFFKTILKFHDGDQQVLYQNLQGLNNKSFNLSAKYTFKKEKIDKLYNIYFTGARGRGHKCAISNRFFDEYAGISGYCQTTSFINNSSNQVLSQRNITIKISPIINITPNDPFFSYKGNKDYIYVSVLNDSKGFPSNIYQWEYQIVDYKNGKNIDSNKWVSMPSDIIGKESFRIKPNDIFPDEQILNKRLFFRIKTCNGESKNYIWYDILPSAPHISTHTVSPVTCSDSEDGKIRLNFDRTLKTGETLEFTLTNTDTGVIVNNYDVTAALRAETSYSIESLAPGKYKLNLRGIYNSNLTYTDGSQHSVEFEVKKPDPVGFSLTSQTNVFCFGGNDGAFRIDGTGGQNSYQYSLDNGATWVNFSHTQHTIITGLSAGTYNVKVRDTNHCIAKNNRGNDKVITVNITEPTKAIAFSDIENVQPKGHGLSNGYISIKVTGGTPFADGSYHYQWRKDSPTGAVIPSSQITTDKTTHPFTIVLKNIPAGKYYLTVKDKNHAGATSNLQSCGIISREFIVTQPDPLIANIMQEQGISCHKDNNDAFKMDVNGNGINDNAEDGSIKAQVKGGVGGYQYQWQKEAGGVFTNISGATRNILENLTAGKYKLIIKDRNDNTTSAVFQLNFPSQLKINLSSTTLKCNGLEDGKVTVSATGGTGGYTYLWNTLDTSPIVEGLGAGNYFVTVTDSKSCSVKGSIEIEQPSQLEITDVDIKNPVCHGATNGKISVRASGGRAPYSLVWSNGMEGETISGLRAGKYVLTFTDANGCHMTKEYILTNPEKFTVDLGGDITLCVGDSKEYDITVSDRAATYQWKDANGRVISINPKIRISQAGTYTAIITNTKGCIATDQITVRNSTEELHPHMMLSTQAYVERTVKLVNTSNPRPQRVEWIVPRTNQVQVIEQNDDYLEVKFHSTGSYNFGLKGHQGACEKIFYKTVVVEENLSGVDIDPTRTSNIKEFTIVPNPNNGDYKVIVKLYEESDIKLRIIDMLSEEPFAPILKNRSVNYEIHFNQPTLPTGTYLIILETKGESQVKKMIVN